MEEGIVYVLKNASMPNLVKIGMTSRSEISIRMSELYSTGVPIPFECCYAGKVKDVKKVEAALHHAFSSNRINPSREFFSIDETQVIAILKLLTIEDLTPQVSNELNNVDEASKNAQAEFVKSKRPKFNFQQMGIPVNSILKSINGKNECVVVDDKQVKFNDIIMSFTSATRQMLNLEYNVAPNGYWTFQGKKLKDIYNETYQDV